MTNQTSTFDPRKEKIYEIIFEADTPMGKLFDIVLIFIIVLSVGVVMLETVDSIREKWGTLLIVAEWFFTIFFTIEYITRLWVARNPKAYATSFFGVIDLLAILPTYLSFFIFGAQYFLIIRLLRLIRVFRIFKLAHFLNEGKVITSALSNSKNKITVFLTFIVIMVTIMGAIMFFIEGDEVDTGFTSIPRSIYWAIVTITTVGYGDISPVTPMGQFIAAIVMIMGYAVIAVPTGIVTSEITRADDKQRLDLSTQVCNNCFSEGHDTDAEYCKFCGEILNAHIDDD